MEMIRALRATRRSAVKARTQAANQLKALLVSAPEELKSELRDLSTARLVRRASRFRLAEDPDSVTAATKLSLRSVARRYQHLGEEIKGLDEQLDRLVAEAAPESIAVDGVSTDTAASLLVTVGDNPERLHSEAAFAHLCGVAPIPASSGKTVRHPPGDACPTTNGRGAKVSSSKRQRIARSSICSVHATSSGALRRRRLQDTLRVPTFA